MGIISSIRNALDPTKADEQKQREQLDFLLTAAQTKLQMYEKDLLAMLNDPAQLKGIAVAGPPVQWQQDYRANVAVGADDQVNRVIDQFFSGTTGAILEGFKTLVKLEIAAILGNATSGEQEDQQFFDR